MLPRLGFTLGDPAGCGAELAIKLLSETDTLERGWLRIFGDLELWCRTADGLHAVETPRLAVVHSLEELAAAESAGATERHYFVAEPSLHPSSPVPPGVASQEGGELVLRTLTVAVDAHKRGLIDGLLFMPVRCLGRAFSVHVPRLPLGCMWSTGFGSQTALLACS